MEDAVYNCNGQNCQLCDRLMYKPRDALMPDGRPVIEDAPSLFTTFVGADDPLWVCGSIFSFHQHSCSQIKRIEFHLMQQI